MTQEVPFFSFDEANFFSFFFFLFNSLYSQFVQFEEFLNCDEANVLTF